MARRRAILCHDSGDMLWTATLLAGVRATETWTALNVIGALAIAAVVSAAIVRAVRVMRRR